MSEPDSNWGVAELKKMLWERHCTMDRASEMMHVDSNWYRPLLFGLSLTQLGQTLVDSWLAGDESAYVRLLSKDNEGSEDTEA